jgi:hypothetical protein
VVLEAALFGFDASSLERSGRDEVGIGGGAADSGRAVGTVGVLEAELKPIDNADFLGAAGLMLPWFVVLGEEDGSLEGSAGLEGSCGLAGSCTAGNTFGEDLLCCRTGPRSGRVGARLGGKGGKVDASKEGARMVKSDPELLVAELIPVRVDAVEIDDLVDIVDSLDCFLLTSGLADVSEGVLGGNCGAVPDGCLGGNFGAALLAGRFGIVGGTRWTTPFISPVDGWFPVSWPASAADAYIPRGGTLVVCGLDGRSGLFFGIGGGPD